MAAADITKAQVATWFGGTLTTYLGKWVALIGDDSGTPVVAASADSYEQLQSYIGIQPNNDVANGTGAYIVVFIPLGMG